MRKITKILGTIIGLTCALVVVFLILGILAYLPVFLILHGALGWSNGDAAIGSICACMLLVLSSTLLYERNGR